MSKTIEGAPAPKSEVEQALAELEKEGHTIEGREAPAPKEEPKEVAKDEEPKDEPKDAPKDEPKDKPEDEPKKPERTPTMVEAWKLEVATSQNEKNKTLVAELSAKLEEINKQKAPVTQVQKDDIAAEIKALAGDKEVDVEFLTKFAENLLTKAEAKYKPAADAIKTIDDFKQKQMLEGELNEYSKEFDKDVLPLVKDLNLSDTTLSDLKKSLRDIAFSETYAKVPLKEIFAIKQSTFNLTAPKKSSEGKGPKGRATEVVDLDNMSEEDFGKLTPAQVEEFTSRKGGTGGWSKPSARK